jgi:hypothetical protein
MHRAKRTHLKRARVRYLFNHTFVRSQLIGNNNNMVSRLSAQEILVDGVHTWEDCPVTVLDCGGGALNCFGGSRSQSIPPLRRFSGNEEAKGGPDTNNQNGDSIVLCRKYHT